MHAEHTLGKSDAQDSEMGWNTFSIGWIMGGQHLHPYTPLHWSPTMQHTDKSDASPWKIWSSQGQCWTIKIEQLAHKRELALAQTTESAFLSLPPAYSDHEPDMFQSKAMQGSLNLDKQERFITDDEMFEHFLNELHHWWHDLLMNLQLTRRLMMMPE